MTLLYVAYMAALALWVPLVILATLQSSVRRHVMVPIVGSTIAAIYEAYMSLVWSHTVSNPIRVDILLVMFALGVVDAIGGFSLVSRARGRPDRKPLMLVAGHSAEVTLKRGETLPGFILDLAPVATKKENRQWLEALTTAGMITWKVPPTLARDRP